jgi:DNA-binding response OmpR family regulator
MEPRGLNQNKRPQSLRVPGAKALLIHEDPSDLRFYCNILTQRGYRVQTCNSYQQGVDCLEKDLFDFVIVSQGTPRFEGSCVLKRATEINRSQPVLVVARCVDMNSYLEAMQLGAVDYLAEPLTAAELGRVLENHPPCQRIDA